MHLETHPAPCLHAEVVFNARGEREDSLAAAAREMLGAFEALLARLVEPDTQGAPHTHSGTGSGESSGPAPGVLQREESVLGGPHAGSAASLALDPSGSCSELALSREVRCDMPDTPAVTCCMCAIVCSLARRNAKAVLPPPIRQ